MYFYSFAFLTAALAKDIKTDINTNSATKCGKTNKETDAYLLMRPEAILIQ